MTPDPRRNVPSASEAYRLDNCPGARKAAACCPPLPAGDDASMGIRVHAALETGPMSPAWEALKAGEEQTGRMCWNQMLQVVSDWDGQDDSCADVAEDMWNRGAKEQRLGLTALGKVIPVTPESKATFVFTGMADVVVKQGNRAIVMDYKTGREEVSDSADNAQLRALAVLVAGSDASIEEVTVCIIQPWVGKPKPAVFDKAALSAARDWLNDLLLREKNATPEDLRAGDWCKYCPAMGYCKATRQEVMEIAKPMRLETLPVGNEKAALFARACELDAETLLDIKDRMHLIGMMANAIEGAIRARVEKGDPDICARWELTPGKKVREITDVAAAYAALEPHGITLDDFWSAAKVSLGPLEAALQIRSGNKKKKDGTISAHYSLSLEDAKKQLTETLSAAGALAMKECQPQLKETKPQLQ